MPDTPDIRRADEPLLSVVMCCYGVADYLPQAIECLRAQSVTDWELLIVDDASPDAVGEIAAAAAADDPRISVITLPENGGVSAARNRALEQVRGRYVWMPDPDDGFDADLLGHVRASLSHHPAQMVVFGARECQYRADGSLSHETRIVPVAGEYDSPEALRPHILELERSTLLGYPWNKVYEVAHLRESGATFPAMALNEDLAFNVEVCDDMRTMNVLAIAPYRYAKRMATNMTAAFVDDYYDVSRKRISLLFEQQKRWGMLDDGARATLGSLYARFILGALEHNCDPRAHMTHADRIAWARDVMADPLFAELIPCARAEGSKTLSFAIAVLNGGRAGLWCAAGRAVHLVRSAAPMLFAKTKRGR